MNRMPDYLTPDLLGGSYLYSDSSSANSMFSYVVSLTMSVDPTVLRKVVGDLMTRFPQFAVAVRREEDAYVYRQQDEPVAIYSFEEREKVCAGTGLPADHLFLISCSGKTIHFDFHRALADEKGVLVFIKAILYRYLLLSGYDVGQENSILSPEGEFMEMEAEDSFIKLDDIPASRPVWYMDAKAFCLPDRKEGLRNEVLQLRIPLSKVKGEERDYCSMPASLIPPFFSHSLRQAYHDEIPAGQYIISLLQINLRQYFPTPSIRPFFVNIPLAYNRLISEYPVRTVLMSQKKMVEAQIRTDALAYNAQKEIACLDGIASLSTSAEKVSALRDAFRRSASEATYSFSNIGNIIMPESVMQFVTEFYPVIPASIYPFSLSTVTFKGDLIITVAASSGRTETVCRQFAALLNQYDIHTFIADRFDYYPLYYKP